MGSTGRLLKNYQDRYINFVNNTARLDLEYKEFIEEQGFKYIPFKTEIKIN